MADEYLTVRGSSPRPATERLDTSLQVVEQAAEERHFKGRNESRPGNGSAKAISRNSRPGSTSASRGSTDNGVHPSWLALIKLCRELGHGEIERLSIQDGLPVLAETVRKKCRFPR
ncbi:MAG: hypothetical protein AB1898_29600 [Acidobacteriota bacterium]